MKTVNHQQVEYRTRSIITRVFFLPQFSLRFTFESGLYCREVNIYMIIFSSKFTTKNRISKYFLQGTYYLPILFFVATLGEKRIM